MRVTAIQAKIERKRQDRSARRAEKRRRRAGMLRRDAAGLRGDPPNFGRLRDHRPRSGRKTLDRLAQLGDPDARRQATWGMSGKSS